MNDLSLFSDDNDSPNPEPEHALSGPNPEPEHALAGFSFQEHVRL